MVVQTAAGFADAVIVEHVGEGAVVVLVDGLRDVVRGTAVHKFGEPSQREGIFVDLVGVLHDVEDAVKELGALFLADLVGAVLLGRGPLRNSGRLNLGERGWGRLRLRRELLEACLIVEELLVVLLISGQQVLGALVELAVGSLCLAPSAVEQEGDIQ